MSDLPVQPPVHDDSAQPVLSSQSDDGKGAWSQQSTLQQDPITPVDAVVTTSVLQAAQAYDPLNPPHAGGKPGLGVKERVSSGLDTLVQEVPGAQVIETEKSAEIPPEVESWMEKVDHHEIAAPKEVVVADQTSAQPTGHYASDPVIILPISHQKVQTGMKKSVAESIRWLAEWCLRVIKKFHGMVVYREESQGDRS
ncbi:MAG: hypothetical protein HZA34_02660 [Candidatus Pacebacteria bacterium]|nr:hypothetical protein [Candidatus Paceibacterota bacterium]